ncbi:MAG: replication-associated recombination protein A [Candidatus Eisenbacteria bacterium]|nr:replication-associated recombination protein A [Candidatus Eisenbacteria bacterium]
MELFSSETTPPKQAGAPLADRMRPRSLEEFVGQEHIVGPGKVLRKAIENDEIQSVIFWGPPGTGKTTLARIIANMTDSHFAAFSAVTSGVKEIREVIARSTVERKRSGRRTILFVDEIHRFNKAQQDAFLPHVENGTIVLIGATTENPSFEVISALLSRSKVFVLRPLSTPELELVLERATIDQERGLASFFPVVERDAISFLAGTANGDARVALNALELAVLTTAPDAGGRRTITLAAAQDAMQKRSLLYDKEGEEHYNIISALHKSMRGGDPDASLYWLARMLEAGEDPLYVARRLVRFASEDVGNADPQALLVAVAAKEAVHFIGMPEGNTALAQTVIYLATAPKSNAVYEAYQKVQKDVAEGENPPVPLQIRNAPTGLMKELGYGKDYKYPHDSPDKVVDQEYFPEALTGRQYYRPGDTGFESVIKERMEEWREKRQALRRSPGKPE